jgi:OFA family oxalate/formate antiporter-like MFS transporter
MVSLSENAPEKVLGIALCECAVPTADDVPKGVKRYLVLIACIVMLVFLGTGQAWSVFVKPLAASYHFTSYQTQMVFTLSTLFFCVMMVIAGRFHDRWGPRPLGVASAVITGIAWLIASAKGSDIHFLWLAVGVLASTGSAVGYVCPIATAAKWFPKNKGLVCGLAAAGFAGGPILLSNVTEALLARQWNPLEIFHLIGLVYAPIILVTGLMMAVPPGQPGTDKVASFSRGKLFVDRRFWTLFAGMFFGTLPYLTVMGNVKPIGENFSIGKAALIAISVVAAGNAFGRIFWGIFVDKLGPRRSMLSAQAIMIVSMLCLVLFGRGHPLLFMIAVCGAGFCYGSNFAIYPATVARLYGTHVMGSVYALIMAAQAISSFAPSINGKLFDITGSFIPGLSGAAGLAIIGIVVTAILSKPLAEQPKQV